jgi:hypothetical protein
VSVISKRTAIVWTGMVVGTALLVVAMALSRLSPTPTAWRHIQLAGHGNFAFRVHLACCSQTSLAPTQMALGQHEHRRRKDILERQ